MITKVCLALVLAGLFISAGHAETSDWLKKNQVKRYLRQLEKEKLRPTKIECRVGKEAWAPLLVRFRSVPNKDNRAWNVWIHKDVTGPRKPQKKSDWYSYAATPSGASWYCQIAGKIT